MAVPRCKRCQYRAKEKDWNNCDYALITGHSRTSLFPDLLDPRVCPLYKRGSRINCPSENVSASNKPRHKPTYDWNYALRLHREGRTTREIAAALGCDYTSVWLWKKTKGLNKKK